MEGGGIDAEREAQSGRDRDPDRDATVLFEAGLTEDDALQALEDTALLAPGMEVALSSYLNHLTEGGRAILKPNDAEHLRAFFTHLIAERNRRAQEMKSPEIAEAAHTADGLFPYPPYALLCIDGRVTITNGWGISGRMKGGSMQLPAGDSRDFLQAANGSLFLVPKSRLQVEIDEALKKEPVITELLDSHLGCLARHEQEHALGNNTEDHGLLADVIRKKEIAKAMSRYGEKQEGKKIIPIQTAFDPHTGFAYLGLEKDDVIAYGQDHGGFTESVLAELVTSGLIINNQDLARRYNDQFEAEWDQFNPKPDRKKHYKETIVQFWRAMQRLAPVLLADAQNQIRTLYPDLEEGKELQMRAMLLLANAFSGFCNNHEGDYEFGQHEESFVSVTPSDFGPFAKYTGFRVYDGHLRRLGGDVVTAEGIVRQNREAERVRKPPQYATKEEFRAAPVAVVVKQVLRDPEMTEERWDKVIQLDWSFLETIDWAHMEDNDFNIALYRANKGITLGIPLVIAINALRQKMIQLYYPYNGSPSAEQLINGKLVALPVICDSDRGLRMIVPFYRRGFTELDTNGTTGQAGV